MPRAKRRTPASLNLLVTNTGTPQAYAIIRALRPFARRIVATVEEGRRFADLRSHAALSRLVDARRRVPSPVEDWQAGRIGRENTPGEAAFVEALLRVCREERIDTIFPSWDPHVYVVAKNRERLDAEGVVAPVPDYETVLAVLDKHRTLTAAREVGFPIPRTALYENGDGLDAFAAEVGFPLVVKPRVTSGGRGMVIARDRRELHEALPRVVAAHGNPLLQEYVPGGQRGSVQFVVDRDGRVVFAFRKEFGRRQRVTARLGTTSESSDPGPHVERAAALLARIRFWGAIGAESILDPRDGVYKLMELNPRFPRQLWNRTALGINEPLMCLRIARGEPVTPVRDYPRGVLFIAPVDDAQLLAFQIADRVVYRAKRRLRLAEPLDPLSAPPALGELIRSFLATYRADNPKVLDPYFRFFTEDPLVSLAWWLQFSTWVAGRWPDLGR